MAKKIKSKKSPKPSSKLKKSVKKVIEKVTKSFTSIKSESKNIDIHEPVLQPITLNEEQLLREYVSKNKTKIITGEKLRELGILDLPPFMKIKVYGKVKLQHYPENRYNIH